jgi:cell division protein FtsL
MTRVINAGLFLILLALAVGLYKAKTEAEDDQHQVARLEGAIADEQESVRVMRNEISYLESPDRLLTLAREKLGLVPVDPLRVVTLDEAPLLIETPPGEPASGVAAATYSEGGEP